MYLANTQFLASLTASIHHRCIFLAMYFGCLHSGKCALYPHCSMLRSSKATRPLAILGYWVPLYSITSKGPAHCHFHLINTYPGTWSVCLELIKTCNSQVTMTDFFRIATQREQCQLKAFQKRAEAYLLLLRQATSRSVPFSGRKSTIYINIQIVQMVLICRERKEYTKKTNFREY